MPFVEVSLNGTQANAAASWDTHADNFNQVKLLSQVLDPAWATLMSDLRDRGMLENTLVVWMGEFGRTPVINPNGGRDHFPIAWSTALGGAGIHGGQAYGNSGPDGMKVVDKPVKGGFVSAAQGRVIRICSVSRLQVYAQRRRSL